MDIRTAGSVVAVTAVFLTVVLLVQQRQNRQYPGLGLLACAQSVTLLAFGVSLFRVPSGWASVVAMFSVSATVFSLVLILAGLLAFLERRVPWRLLGAYAALTVLVLANFILISPSLHARRVATYVLISAVLAALVVALTRGARPYAHRAGIFLRLVFAVACLFYLGLAVATLLRPDGVADVWTSTPLVVLAYLGAVVLMLMWTFGFVSAVAEHLRFDQAEDRENLRQVFQATPDATAISRVRDGVVTEVNEGFSRMFGLSRDQVIGRGPENWQVWVHPGDQQRMLDELETTGQLRDFATTLLVDNGVRLDVEISGRLLRLNDEAHTITVLRDVTERARLERELRRQALTDELTGVANRRAFLAALGEQVGRCALVVMDLDGFKQINDTLGHAAGDALVRHFAQVVGTLTPPGAVLGRLGGDEFGVLLADTRGPVAREWAEQVLDVLHGVTFSAGVSDGGATVDEMMARADQALYEAKRRGRNCVVCESV